MSTVYYTLGGDYNPSVNFVVYVTVSLAPNGNYDIREFPEFGVGYAAFNFDTGSGPIFFQNSSSSTSDLFYANAGYLFEFSDNTNRVSIVGGAFGDIIRTGTGGDALDGGGGDDTLAGLGGDDRYVVDSAADRVVEAAGGGTDSVFATTSYTLAANQEIEVLSAQDAAGTGEIDLTGNGLANTLNGNAGANVLSGGGGSDLLVGYAGEDILVGGAGGDTLNGGADSDVMRGGEGDDTYIVGSAGDQVLEAAGGGGADRVNASINYVLAAGLQIEILGTTSAAGTGAINLTGNEFAQTLYGNAGANVLNGAGGADTLYGYGGSDTYVVDHADDQPIEAISSAGSDRVNTSINYVLAAGQGIEILGTTSLAGTAAIDLTGNALDQTIYGNSGANILDGAGGTDILSGFAGADTFAFTAAFGAGNVDRITDFSSAADTIRLNQALVSNLATGTLVESAFKDFGAPGASVDADDRILYDRGTGALYYDSNGSGDGGRVQFAMLDTRPTTLTGADFVVA